MTTLEIAELLFKIILIGLGLYLAFFKSYFQEKGKNLATSEDIEELTLKVESVKQNFIEKNASLKAKLDLLTNLQINHKNEERNSIIDFHKNIKSWISLLTEPSPILVDSYDNQEINTKIHHYEVLFNKVIGAEALLELYVDDDKLTELIHKLKMNVLEHLALHPSKCLFNLKQNNNEFDYQEKMPTDTLENVELKYKKHAELLENRKAIFEEYRTNMMKGYKIIITLDSEYRTYIRQYISKLSSE